MTHPFFQEPRSPVEQTVEEALSLTLPIEFQKPDWTYKDLAKLSLQTYDIFLETVGKENLIWITATVYSDGTTRGQVLISPEGMRRIIDFLEKEKI
jgi:hypothetical protein